MDQRTLALGLGALGLAGLVTWALWPKRKALGGLGDEHLINQSARFYEKKYGISPEDARRLVMSPQRSKIDREIEEWRAQYGYPEANSPLVRGYVRDRVRALAGMGRLDFGAARKTAIELDHEVDEALAERITLDMPPSEISRRLSQLSTLSTELYAIRPRPLQKLYGARGPTPEQLIAYKENLKTWNRAYRRAQKAHKDGVVISNEIYRRGGFGDFGAPRPHMLQVIASEARSPEEYARRAEAWAAAEAKPPTMATIAKAYRKGKPAEVARLLRRAKAARLAQTQARWRGYVNQPEEAEDLID